MSAQVTIPALRRRDAGAFKTLDLPLTASIRRLTLIATAGGFLCLSLLVMASGLLIAIPQAYSASQSNPWLALPLAALCLCLGAIMVAMATSGLLDLRTPDPALTLSDAGILDRRVADELLPWSEIGEVTSLRSANSGIVLTLRTPRATRFRRFHPGAFGMPWNKSPTTAFISIRFLTVSPAIIERVILTLARRHGVAIAARNAAGTSAPLDVGPIQ